MSNALTRSGPHLPPSLALPPIERLPGEHSSLSADPRRPEALQRFLDTGTRRWSGEPLPLPRAASCVLWAVLVANTALGAWLIAVRTGAAPCSGLPCSIATLGGHPDLLLALCTVVVGSLAAVASMTRGLSRAGAAPLAVMVVGGVVGVIALLGIVALLALAALCLTGLVVFLLAVINRV